MLLGLYNYTPIYDFLNNLDTYTKRAVLDQIVSDELMAKASRRVKP